MHTYLRRCYATLAPHMGITLVIVRSCITLLWLHHNHKISISDHKNGLVSSHQSVRRGFIFYVLVVRLFLWNQLAINSLLVSVSRWNQSHQKREANWLPSTYQQYRFSIRPCSLIYYCYEFNVRPTCGAIMLPHYFLFHKLKATFNGRFQPLTRCDPCVAATMLSRPEPTKERVEPMTYNTWLETVSPSRFKTTGKRHWMADW